MYNTTYLGYAFPILSSLKKLMAL